MANTKTHQNKMRKGQFSTLATLIIILAAAVMLIFLVGLMLSGAKRAASDEECRKCIQLANVKGAHLADEILPSCECPREDLLIKYDDIVENGVINQNKAHKILAEAMRRCLYRFHDGTLDPAADYKDLEDEAICRPCFDIVFDKDLRNFMEKHLKDLDRAESDEAKLEIYKEYAITNPIPYLTRRINPNDPESETYWKYLLKEEPPEKLDEKQYQMSALLEGSTIQLRYFRSEQFHLSTEALVVGGVLAFLAGPISWTFVVGGIVTFAADQIIQEIRDKPGTEATFGIKDLNTFMVAFPEKNTFKECGKRCEHAEGGILLLPPSFDYSAQWTDEGGKNKWPVCSMVIG